MVRYGGRYHHTIPPYGTRSNSQSISVLHTRSFQTCALGTSPPKELVLDGSRNILGSLGSHCQHPRLRQIRCVPRKVYTSRLRIGFALGALAEFLSSPRGRPCHKNNSPLQSISFRYRSLLTKTFICLSRCLLLPLKLTQITPLLLLTCHSTPFLPRNR